MRNVLFNLWILIPKKTACYKAGICVTDTYFNWFNPLTYIYLLLSVVRIGFLYLKYGKEFLNNNQSKQK